MVNKNQEYGKKSSPLWAILYIAAVAALIVCIAYFVYSSREAKKRYEEDVRNAAEYETEPETYQLRTTDESESETAAEKETAAVSEPEQKDESEEETPEGGETGAGETEIVTEGENVGSAAEEQETETRVQTEETGIPDETENAVSASADAGTVQPDSGETGAESETETEAYVPDGYPRITLTQKKATIQVGDTFNATDYVKEITNSPENIYTLWRNIRVDGSYDTGTAGIYQLVYYVLDSEGHSSNRATLILEVQDPQTEARDETTEKETEEAQSSQNESVSEEN